MTMSHRVISDEQAGGVMDRLLKQILILLGLLGAVILLVVLYLVLRAAGVRG